MKYFLMTIDKVTKLQSRAHDGNVEWRRLMEFDIKASLRIRYINYILERGLCAGLAFMS